MTKFRIQILFFGLIAYVFLSGCSITKNMEQGDFLLHKNTVSIHKKKSGIKHLHFNEDDFYGLIQQQPNEKFLGIFKLGAWVNSSTSRGKQTKFKKWLNKGLGQPPVIFDAGTIGRSVDQMKLFLNNNGYFHSTVSTGVLKHKRKAAVEYDILLSKPYRISKVEYVISDTVIRDLVYGDSAKSLIKPGTIYRAETLDDERYRISSLLRNVGYYFFAPEFIFFEVDSALNNHTLNVYANIQQFINANDTAPENTPTRNHQKYYLNKISIDPDFVPVKTDTSRMKVFVDTSQAKKYGRFNIYYRDKLKIRPHALKRALFLEPSCIYREQNEYYTYRQLSGFPLFAFTSLHFSEAPDFVDPNDSTKKFIDCFIELTRKPVQSFSIETEGTTSGSKLGLAGNFVYRNLNIFRGGEVFSVKLTGGVEWQAGTSNRDPVLLFFNTVQTGAEVSLNIPRFIIPFVRNRIPNTLRPNTTITTGVNYQNRPDYERYITNVAYGYNWMSNEFVRHSLIPFEINSVSIFPDSSFLKRLEDLNDLRLLNQYTDHFIMSAKYTYIFNNQQRNKVENFTFFRWNFEASGNVINAVSNLAGVPKNENNEFTVWNIPFAQFARTDVDFRYYFALREDHTVVCRTLLGVGVPYGNSKVLPFEKGFYAGGSNGMRGWNYRSLGPGSFTDSTNENFERMGDVAIEANIEYRFPVYKWFKGVLFTDAGNVWLLNFSNNYPGGKFEFKQFVDELAVDAGLGLRLDLSFFIFRIDAATAFRNPALPIGQRWQFNNLKLKNVIWNFGIGYPF